MRRVLVVLMITTSLFLATSGIAAASDICLVGCENNFTASTTSTTN